MFVRKNLKGPRSRFSKENNHTRRKEENGAKNRGGLGNMKGVEELDYGDMYTS